MALCVLFERHKGVHRRYLWPNGWFRIDIEQQWNKSCCCCQCLDFRLPILSFSLSISIEYNSFFCIWLISKHFIWFYLFCRSQRCNENINFLLLNSIQKFIFLMINWNWRLHTHTHHTRGMFIRCMPKIASHHQSILMFTACARDKRRDAMKFQINLSVKFNWNDSSGCAWCEWRKNRNSRRLKNYHSPAGDDVRRLLISVYSERTHARRNSTNLGSQLIG